MTSETFMTANTPRKVLITGATGLIGGRLCEVMALSGNLVPRAFVHSTASAARITRFPLDFYVGDLGDLASVDRSMDGCDAVVHLARGDKRVMEQGLENVLRVASDHGVSRFVHVSSVAVYGNSPPPESASEATPAVRSDMEYGNIKLKQEHRVLRHAKRSGLPVVILRPPNVYGPYAGFTLDLMNKIRQGKMAILDGGRNPCNLVYVDNLVEAILLALWRPEAPGQVFHVTDPEPVSWERCITDHAVLVGVDVPRVVAAALAPPARERLWRDSLRALADGEVQQSLARIPLVRRWFQWLPEPAKQAVRARLRRGEPVRRRGSPERRFSSDHPFIAGQKRTVAHSSEKASRLLGY